MKPVRLHFENFLSFESLDYFFENNIVALIGQNKTDDGQGSNGSGKSGFQQGIFFAITGNNLRCSLDKKLIRRGQDSSIVELDLFCPTRNETLSIRREIFMKSSSKLNIKINNEDVSFATVKDGNDFIIDWIGITSDDLKSYFIICKEYYKSFFKTSNNEKLALISRFINFSSIDKTKDIINEDLSVLNKGKQSLEKELSSLEGYLLAKEESLEKEKSRDLEQEKEEKKKYLLQNIEDSKDLKNRYLKDIEKSYDKISDLKVLLDETKRSLDKLDSVVDLDKSLEEIKKELGKIKNKQNDLLDLQNSIQEARGEIKSTLRKIQINLAGKITCPKCRHEFLTLKDTTLEEELEKKEKLNNDEKEIILEEDRIIKKLKKYEDILSEYLLLKTNTEDSIEELKINTKNIQRKISSIESEIKDHEKSIERYKNNISKIDDDIKVFEIKIKNLEEESYTVDLSPFEKEIKETEKDIKKVKKKISTFCEDIFKKNEWINRFKEFKMYLATEQIKKIQTFANDILTKENSDLRLLIEAFKKDSKGNIKEEITPYVLRDEVESFWYYSGGERVRVEIAIILAIQQMINSTNKNGGLDFLFIDEITEGLSEEGLSDIIEALSFIDYPILITTHINNQNVKSHFLKIEKVNGISKIAI